MFWFKREENNNDEYIQELEDRLDEKNQKEQELRCLFLDLDAADFVIDWNSIDAFSIERNVTYDSCLGKVATTTIGHWVKNAEGVEETCEWALRCSIDQHRILVDEFKNYLKPALPKAVTAKVSK